MNNFETTDILEENENLGNLLKEAREAKNYSLEDLHQITKIKIEHLAAMEANNYENIAAPVYAKGFLKICAQALDLSEEDLVSQYNQMFGEEVKKKKPLNLKPKKPSSSNVKIIGIAGVLAVLTVVLMLFGVFK